MIRLLDRATPLLMFLAVLLAWELACWELKIPRYILPSPVSILVAAGSIDALEWWHNIAATLQIVLAGFALSLLISLPLAVLLVSSRFLSRSVVPFLIIIQSTPIIAIAPILIVLLGAGALPRVVITALITFFPMVVSTTTGLRATPEELIELSRSLRGGRRREFLHIRLPYAVPYIFSALRVSVTLAVIGAVVAEFVAAQKGLGYLILYTTSLFKVPLAFAALAVLVTLSLVLYQLVVQIERRLFPWSLPRS